MNFFLSSRWSVRLALIIIALLALIALTSQWWLPYDPQAIDLPSRLLSPDAQHWLGTDHLGRDIFQRPRRHNAVVQCGQRQRAMNTEEPEQWNKDHIGPAYHATQRCQWG